MDRDTATGIAGALILIAAMGGVFFYERAQFETYNVSWETTTVNETSDAGELQEGESAEHTFTVETERLAEIRAEVSWEGDVGDPDTFAVSMDGPDENLTAEASGDSSPVEALVSIREEPETDTATGRSLEDARDQLNNSGTWDEGSGEWTVTVTLEAAPGGDLPNQNDGSQAYEIAIEADRWEPVFE